MPIPKKSIQKGPTYVPAVIKEQKFNPNRQAIASAINDFLKRGGTIAKLKPEKGLENGNPTGNHGFLTSIINKQWFEIL